MAQKAAGGGGGVIGAGWAARFLLMGWDVAVADPDPEAPRKVDEVLANARAALPGLHDVALPEEGRLTVGSDLAQAVAGADWGVEAVPERVDRKHKVFSAIQGAGPAAPIPCPVASASTDSARTFAADPGRIFVAHPFNPVYLLPLAELVPSPANPPEVVARASEVLTAIGMHPLLVRKEIDAHIADRFLEAVWREALWLVKDGVATTEEIDDAIRYGFGLRWAQMGLFETYRVAGGEAGMRHFIAQFGPCLSWPWTKLMDVPELTDELIDRIASQSDAQSGAWTIRELERIRDRNLVGILRSLKGYAADPRAGWGAGRLLRAQDARMRGPEPALDGPILTVARAVPVDWTDYNGHMNEARYLQAFGDATDHFMELIGCDAAYIASGGSFFTAETHIRHLGEVHAGERIEVRTQLLAAEGKTMHLWHEMTAGGAAKATGEHMLVHVSLETRRASPPGERVAARLAEVRAAHGRLPRPVGAGRAVGQER